MIFLTTADAVTHLQPHIGGGVCDRTRVLARLNQATARFMNRPRKPLHIRRRVRFFSKKDIITMPNEIGKILHYSIDGVPSPLFSEAYEFVSHGPGELDCAGTCYQALEDLGDFHPTMFDIPSMEYNADGDAHCQEPTFSEFTLVAFSDQNSDVGKELVLQGRGEMNERLGTAALGPGTTLAISKWNSTGNITGLDYEALSLSDPIRDISGVSKPVTLGHVYLYAYVPSTYQFYFLSKYHPDETKPRYRRYRITAPNYTLGSSILAWCELGFLPVSHDDDVLLIQNLDALKLMVMAIEMEDERKFQEAKAYEADAYRLIEDQRTADRTHDYNLIQVSPSWGFGDIRRS